MLWLRACWARWLSTQEVVLYLVPREFAPAEGGAAAHLHVSVVACHVQFESPLDYSPRVGSAEVIKNYPDLFTLARVVLLAYPSCSRTVGQQDVPQETDER